MYCRGLNQRSEFSRPAKLRNCTVTVVEIKPERLTCTTGKGREGEFPYRQKAGLLCIDRDQIGLGQDLQEGVFAMKRLITPPRWI